MTQGTSPELVLHRVFEAPVDLVWRTWTDPEHFAAWYGPEGASVSVVQMDVRPGGKRLLCMEVHTPSGTRQMWFTGEYRVTSHHSKLVYTDAMSDSQGNVLDPAGSDPTYPTVTEVTVEFAETAGRTSVTLTHRGIPPGSPGEAGWRAALDRLADVVSDRTSGTRSG